MLKQGYSMKEWALMELLDCGLADLEIIEDAGTDFKDYLDDVGDDKPSLSGFVDYIYRKANEALKKEWADRREEILADIEEKHQANIKEYGEDYETEFATDDDVRTICFYRYGGADDVIREGIQYYFNCLDTHFNIPYAYELEKYGLLDEPNRIIGFTEISC